MEGSDQLSKARPHSLLAEVPKLLIVTLQNKVLTVVPCQDVNLGTLMPSHCVSDVLEAHVWPSCVICPRHLEGLFQDETSRLKLH